jgi:hypothetical protein
MAADIELRHKLAEAIEAAKRRYCAAPSKAYHLTVMEAIEAYDTAQAEDRF